MLEVEFCLMFYRFYDASSYQKVISWNLHASTDRFAKSPPDLRPNISCGQSKISRVGREGNADELVKNHGRSIFFRGFWVFSSKTPCFLMTRICSSKKPSLLQQHSFHEMHWKLRPNSGVDHGWMTSGPLVIFPFSSFFFTENGGEKQRRGFTTSHLVWPLGLQLGSQPTTPRVCLPRLDGAKVMRVKLRSFFVWTWQTFFRQNFRIHWLFVFSSADLGKSWKKYEEPFYNLSHLLHPSRENCGFALTGFQRTKTTSIQKPYFFLMDCNDISSFLTCFPLPFPCKVFSSFKFAMTAWFASADFYRIPFVASKLLIWRVFPNCLI